YRSRREKAQELQQLTDSNESILESIDSGILVLDLQGRVARWNRAMEALYGKRRADVIGRRLEDIFPGSFREALRGSLSPGRPGDNEIANIYKLPLPTDEGRGPMGNVTVAPLQA